MQMKRTSTKLQLYAYYALTVLNFQFNVSNNFMTKNNNNNYSLLQII